MPILNISFFSSLTHHSHHLTSSSSPDHTYSPFPLVQLLLLSTFSTPLPHIIPYPLLPLTDFHITIIPYPTIPLTSFHLSQFHLSQDLVLSPLHTGPAWWRQGRSQASPRCSHSTLHRMPPPSSQGRLRLGFEGFSSVPFFLCLSLVQ